MIERTPPIDPQTSYHDVALSLPDWFVASLRAEARDATPYDGGLLYPYEYGTDEHVLHQEGEVRTVLVAGIWVARALGIPADGAPPFERCFERPAQPHPATVGIVYRQRHQLR